MPSSVAAGVIPSIDVGGAVGRGAVVVVPPPVPVRGAGVAALGVGAGARGAGVALGVATGAGAGPAGARARGPSSPTMALGWMLRSWFLLPDPSSCSVRMCHGAPDTSPAPSRTPPAARFQYRDCAR